MTTDGHWPGYRHDEGLSGHQPLPGRITAPKVAWRHYLGGGLFDAVPVRLGDRYALLILYGGCIHCFDIVGNQIWKSVAMGIEGISAVSDLDNDGHQEIVAGNGKSLFILSAATGEILWSAYLGPPVACGFMHTAALVHHFPSVGPGKQIVVGLLSSNEVILYDCSLGASRTERKQILWMDDYFHPSILALDIDGDGEDEIIVTKYSAIYSFDPATGRQKSVCRWESGGTPKRNYGLFLARDITGTGSADFVVLSDRVSKHLAVIANDGAGNLSVLWDRFLEHIYPTDTKELRYSFNSLVDIDGDGRLEIVVSLYDEAVGRWWLEVIDAVSGELRARADDLYLHGIQQLDHGALPLVCASVERGRIAGGFSRSVVLRWAGDRLEQIWERAESRFAGRCARQSPTTTCFRADIPPAAEVWTIGVDGVVALVLTGPDGRLVLAAERDGEWFAREISSSIEIDSVLGIADHDGDEVDELVVADSRGEVRVIDQSGESLGRIRCGMRFRFGTGAYYRAKPMQSAVVTSGADASFIAVPDGGSRIHLLRVDHSSARPALLHALEGRGRCGPEESFHSVEALGSGEDSRFLYSTIGGENAGLVAVGIDGDVVERWDIPGLPSSRSYDHDRIGIYEYRITSTSAGEVLLVAGYRSSSMNSEEMRALDLATGRTLWRRLSVGEGEDGRGLGPWNAMTLAGTSDGRVARFLAKDTCCALDPLTGELISPPWQLRSHNAEHLRKRGLRVDNFAAYGSVVPCDADGDGHDELLILGAYGGIGLFDADGGRRWWLSAPLSTLSGSFAGVADVDGDGLPEIGLSQSDGDFVCLRADTGLEKWRLHIGEVATDVISCDIDGDGAIEFIASTQQGGLLCIGVGNNGSGYVKWRLELGYSLGTPVAADIDGDGASEIMVVCGDGYLYAIK